MTAPAVEGPTVRAIQDEHRELRGLVRETPVWRWSSFCLDRLLPPSTEVLLKIELFQHTGTFKVRGALSVMRALTADQRARGVTAVSAGNHAIAVAFAARTLGTHAKVAMPADANAARVQACLDLGAEIVRCPDVHAAFAEAERLQREEDRFFVHPFEGERIALGTATLGYEFLLRAGNLDAVAVPIGGGGLCAGVAAAVKRLQPKCLVFGVEPEGADSMHRSFAAGEPRGIEKVRTIADSLGAPFAMPYSFALCRRYVDGLVKVDDDALREAMALLFADMKLAVEPAGAATTAALLGPLRSELSGKRVGLIVCGSNIDAATFGELVAGTRLSRGR
ncbi:MAG: threonine/serine dehydratase [Planctomycetota bacterium]